jgi:hypothetical protein
LVQLLPKWEVWFGYLYEIAIAMWRVVTMHWGSLVWLIPELGSLVWLLPLWGSLVWQCRNYLLLSRAWGSLVLAIICRKFPLPRGEVWFGYFLYGEVWFGYYLKEITVVTSGSLVRTINQSNAFDRVRLFYVASKLLT